MFLGTCCGGVKPLTAPELAIWNQLQTNTFRCVRVIRAVLTACMLDRVTYVTG